VNKVTVPCHVPAALGAGGCVAPATNETNETNSAKSFLIGVIPEGFFEEPACHAA